MKTLSNLLKNVRRMGRSPYPEAWGDARALPFTEGQAVLAPGSIGPASEPDPVR